MQAAWVLALVICLLYLPHDLSDAVHGRIAAQRGRRRGVGGVHVWGQKAATTFPRPTAERGLHLQVVRDTVGQWVDLQKGLGTGARLCHCTPASPIKCPLRHSRIVSCFALPVVRRPCALLQVFAVPDALPVHLKLQLRSKPGQRCANQS